MGPDAAAPIIIEQITEFQKAFTASNIMLLLVQWITIFCYMQSPNSYLSNVPWSGNSSTCIIHVFTALFHLVWYVPSFYITLSHSPPASKSHLSSIVVTHFYSIQHKKKTLKLILSHNSHLSAIEMQFCSPNNKKGKYWLNGVAVWVPRVFVIVVHGHPHQSSHNPHHFHTPHS